jgi:hypothetical protein
MKYDDVFGVSLGDQLTEGQGVTFTRCQAGQSLVTQLSRFPFFGGAKLQGVGPLFRDFGGGVLKHEFNRHHAGLAVDIMLQPGTAETILGQNMVVLFNNRSSILHFHGLIFQNVTIDMVGNPSNPPRASCWRGGGHENHIHIDWHSSANVTWQQIDSVPLLRTNGNVVQMLPMSGNRIASEIRPTTESGTDFSSDGTLQSDLDDLMGRFDRGELQQLDLLSELGLNRC